MAATRLTREESQARTRRRLLDSAAAEFAGNGVEGTSIARIAEAAGYSRGAFYAHFEDTEDLCLQLLEQRFFKYVDHFGTVLESERGPISRARRAGEDFEQMLKRDPDNQRLLLELSLYALRRPRFRARLIVLLAELRAGVTRTFAAQAREQGIEPPIPLERLTMMTFAAANGIAMARLLEPETFPDDLYGEMLVLLFGGLAQRMREQGSEG